jgi:1,4-alpha-glucan branching enzyme
LINMVTVVHSGIVGPTDLHLFNEGTHLRLADCFGGRLATVDAQAGAAFAVWAPNARRVTVVGDFNDWDGDSHQLSPLASSGVWEGFVPGAGAGARYKFRIQPRTGGRDLEKADPFAIATEAPPRTASVLWDLAYQWHDDQWMASRERVNALDAPISIYELHMGSWRRHADGTPLGYRELAPLLVDHVQQLGFTHVELLPIMEHPFGGSWGYQTTGYFAPTARYGTPQDFMAFIDTLHQHGIGVILDWVPSHFPNDDHGLARFDGTACYEHADPKQGLHPDWDTLVFNYGRNEVRAFLLSSAHFWLDRYHADGLRVDAVASMLYLDYSRAEGEWVPNRYGGRENLDAIEFIRALNESVYGEFPDTQTVAEESTAWPMVSRPTYVGGLGFGLKWDMGWMHDTLEYFAHDPVHRSWHHNELTFRAVYQFNENFVLPLSHDEVVHGKRSLLGRMPGDRWQQLANLRLLFGTMIGLPGKKLLFMGAEMGSEHEWNHDGNIEWDLLDDPQHGGVTRWLADLNHTYATLPALHDLDCQPGGFTWVDAANAGDSVLIWERRGAHGEQVVVAANYTPVPRTNYRVGVDSDGWWRELLNSDAPDYGGSGVGNFGRVEVTPIPAHGRPFSLVLTLPPLGVLFLAPSLPE